MTQRIRAVRTAVAVVIVVVITLGLVGCRLTTTGENATTPGSSVPDTKSFDWSAPGMLPPTINKATLVPGPVSRLRPGMPVMVGDGTEGCMTGFYIDYPGPSHPRQQFPAFVTAAQCAQGDDHAPVSVMRAETAGRAPKRTKIGEITYITPGDEQPAVAGEPWTVPTSPLAVFASSTSDWVLPVDVIVNDQTPTSETVQTAEQVEQRKATAKWTNTFGLVVTGRVLDPASTPELKDIPAGIERVVVAADDPTKPIYEWVRGSPVTVDMDGVTHNLGIIVGADEAKRWVVVDLIRPFLAKQGAHLLTAG
jgi:hypothetical protein